MALVHAFAFAVDADLNEHGRAASVDFQAKNAFGEKARVVGYEKVRGGQIRFFKNRGIPVTKRAGTFYVQLPNGKQKVLLCAAIDLPNEFLTRGKQLSRPREEMVDLSELSADLPTNAA